MYHGKNPIGRSRRIMTAGNRYCGKGKLEADQVGDYLGRRGGCVVVSGLFGGNWLLL
jgi:hypothetical protein